MAETPEVVTSELQVETSSTEYPLDVDKPVVTDELDSTFKVGPGESKDGGEGKDGGKEPAKDDEKKDAKKDDEKDAKDDDFVVLDGVKIPKATFDKIAQKRVNKSVAKQREAERLVMAERAEREALAKRLEELESKLPKPAAEQAPKLEDFESMEDFLEARDNWRDTQKAKAEKKAEEKAEPETAYHELPASEQDRVFMESLQPGQAQWLQEGIQEAMRDGAEKFKDFEATVTKKDVRMSPAMMALILQSDVREDVMYYLGKNPEAAKELHEAAIRDENSALRLLGKIESKIESGWTPSGETPADTGSIEVGDEVTPPAKPIPKAPEPITPVSSRGSPAKKDPSRMTPAEYQAWRKAGGGR